MAFNTMNELRESLGLHPLPADMPMGKYVTPDSQLDWSKVRTGILNRDDGTSDMVIYIPLKPEGY